VTIVGARTDGLNGVRWPFAYRDSPGKSVARLAASYFRLGS